MSRGAGRVRHAICRVPVPGAYQAAEPDQLIFGQDVVSNGAGEIYLDVNSALILLVLFQIKHLFADYYLQTPGMLANRGQYLHPGRAMHCLVHVAGSGIAMALVGVDWGLIAVVLVAEWLVHYHIDFGKGAWSNRMDHGPKDASYWRAFGVDQFLHQVTYVAMLWAVI